MTTINGRHGTATLLQHGPDPQPAHLICTWLLTYPAAHRFQYQHLITGIRLTDIPGLRPARRNFPDATTEIAVATLQPRPALTGNRWTPTALTALPAIPLIGQTISIHTDCNDTETHTLTRHLAAHCSNGFLAPAPVIPPNPTATIRTAIETAHTASWLHITRSILETIRGRAVLIR